VSDYSQTPFIVWFTLCDIEMSCDMFSLYPLPTRHLAYPNLRGSDLHMACLSKSAPSYSKSTWYTLFLFLVPRGRTLTSVEPWPMWNLASFFLVFFCI
jgi:hypothetical protein